MIKQAIIPLAGLGTRLLPLTSVLPKELLPINGKPGLEYILEEGINAGSKEFIFIISRKKKYYPKEKKFNIYCYLNKKNKKIALTKNKNLSFLANFKMPEAQMVISNNNLKIKGWNYLCNYKNNISNIKMNINLFYKFTKNKPKKFTWYSIDGSNVAFIPSFTKKIFKKVKKLYI